MTNWTTRAHQRVDLLTDKVSGLEALKQTAAREAKQDSPRLQQDLRELQGWHAELAERKKTLAGRHAWWESLKGDEVEDTWGELHRIEVGVDGYEPMGVLLQLADEHIEQDLPKKRADQIRSRLESQTGQPHQQRLTALQAIREAHDAAASRHGSERNWQRGIVAISAGALAAGPLIVLVQAVIDAAIVPLPSDAPAVPAAALLALVLFFGVLGGLLGALVTQYRIYEKQQIVASTLWFDPMPALTLAKVALGMWMAFFGILLVGTGVVVGVYTSMAAMVLLAFLFGYGQQAVTQFMDKKVASMLEEKKAAT